MAQVFSLSAFGPRLGTRLEGRKAQEALFSTLALLPEGGVLAVDLSGVEVLSGSFADEAIAKVLSRLKGGELPGRYLFLRTPSLELLEDLEAKLQQRQLAVLVKVEGLEGWRVCGWLPPYLAAVFGYVMRRGEARSPEVAKDLGISVKQAHLALKRLGELRLLRAEREARPSGGYQHRYLPIV